MATIRHLTRSAEIERLIVELALSRSDIGKINKQRLAASYAALPPPTRALTDAEVRGMLEPKPVKWHKDLIPNYRTTTAAETITYHRYSTDKQQHSIEHQRQIIADFYESRRQVFRLPPMSANEFSDPETSGKRLIFERRWGGQLACYVRPGDHVVFAYFDRIGRNAVDTIGLLQKFMELGVYVHIVDHPHFQFCEPGHPSTIKQIQDAAIAAENERNLISLRTKRAAGNIYAAGHAMGNGRARCYRPWPNTRFDRSAPVDAMKNPRQLAEFVPAEAALCEIIYHAWAIDSWLVAEIVSALRNRAKTDRRFLRAHSMRPWTRDAVKKLIRKFHAERCRGGVAGMFLTAALNGNGGAN